MGTQKKHNIKQINEMAEMNCCRC